MRVPRVKNCRLSQKLKRILQSISFRSGTATRRCKTKACTEENAIAPHSKVALGARSGMAPAAGPLSSRSGFAAEVAPVAPAAPANNNDCFATSSSNAQSQPPGEAARGAAGTVLAAVRRANALHSTWWCRMDCLPAMLGELVLAALTPIRFYVPGPSTSLSNRGSLPGGGCFSSSSSSTMSGKK